MREEQDEVYLIALLERGHREGKEYRKSEEDGGGKRAS
jgi:hypothetical protein